MHTEKKTINNMKQMFFFSFFVSFFFFVNRNPLLFTVEVYKATIRTQEHISIS